MSASLKSHHPQIPTNTFLKATNIGKIFSGSNTMTEALRDVSFTLKEGEIIAIVGISGCGKSTLLRILAGLIPQSEGNIRIEGKTTFEYRQARKIGFVFQKPGLFGL